MWSNTIIMIQLCRLKALVSVLLFSRKFYLIFHVISKAIEKLFHSMQVRPNYSCDPWPKCHLIQQLMSQLRLCFLVIDVCSRSFREADLHIKTRDIFNSLKGNGPLCTCAGGFIIFNEFSHDIASTAWAGRIISQNKFHSSMFKARAVFRWAWIVSNTSSFFIASSRQQVLHWATDPILH